MTLLLCCHVVCPRMSTVYLRGRHHVGTRCATPNLVWRFRRVALRRGATRRGYAAPKGLGKTKTTLSSMWFWSIFGGWAVEGIQMLPVVPASWWHIFGICGISKPESIHSRRISFQSIWKLWMLQRATARCTGSRGFLEEGVGAESLLGVQGLANPAEFEGIQRYSPGCVWKCWLNPIVPNGFADHYPVLKNGYFIGNINPTFSDKPTWFKDMVDVTSTRDLDVAFLFFRGLLWSWSFLQ